MRLVCPNCGAQYEVPDDVIPQTGRDVQCSNCGHTWFQVHPEQDAGLAEDLDQPMLDDDEFGADEAPPEEPGEIEEPEDTPTPDTDEPIENAPEAAPDDWVAPDETLADTSVEDESLWSDEDADDAWAQDDFGGAAPQIPTPPPEDYEDDYESWDETPAAAADTRRKLDPDVADLLREEAEREARQRAAERDPLESQPELGLSQTDEDEAARRQREAQERMARLRGSPVPETEPSDMDRDDDAAAAAAAAAAASRRDLLPDIDEINSTLRSTSDRRPAMADDHEHPGAADTVPRAAAKSGGFSRGFLFVVLVMVLAIVLYIFAPSLAETVPALRGPLAAYVEMMNGLRLWIDEWLRGVLGWLDGMSGEG